MDQDRIIGVDLELKMDAYLMSVISLYAPNVEFLRAKDGTLELSNVTPQMLQFVMERIYASSALRL